MDRLAKKHMNISELNMDTFEAHRACEEEANEIRTALANDAEKWRQMDIV